MRPIGRFIALLPSLPPSWSQGSDSNRDAPHYECGALPIELPRQYCSCRAPHFLRSIVQQNPQELHGAEPPV